MVNIQDRLVRLDWKEIEASLWQRGYAKTDPLLTGEECDALIAVYGNDELFRSRIDMKRFRFGEGEYKYFTYPLPPLVQTLREEIYPRLETAIREVHPYELPEIVAVSITRGLPAYLAWVEAEIGPLPTVPS